MTGKVFESDAPNFSLLIIPVAAGIILVAMAWPFLLLFLALLVAWKVYDKIRWENQCQRFNPSFNQLIKENKGCLTVLDFSNKTSLNDKAAKRFLEQKAQEYGAVRKNVGTKGIIYYFITASALGSIFDESEETDEEEPSVPVNQLTSASNVLAELAQLKKTQSQTVETPSVQPLSVVLDETLASTSAPSVPVLNETLEPTQTEEVNETPVLSSAESQPSENSLKLIQSELAKRLDINSSTIGKRKSEPDFTEWSQSKDPEGIAWIYVPSTKFFIPKTS